MRSCPVPLLALCLLSPSVTLGQGYASAVEASEREIFISEPLNPYAPGTVLVYRPGPNGQWQEARRLQAEGGTNLDRFGRSISVSGDRLLIGATTFGTKGAAFIFERSGDTWRQAALLSPARLQNGESDGRQVALLGDRAFVASWGWNEGRGTVTVWQRGADGAWTEAAGLSASDAGQGNFFGYAIAPDGDRLLVTAALKDTVKGTAYVFRREASGAWTEEARFRPDSIARNTGFGISAALRGDRAFVGAPGLEGGRGGVFVYQRDASGAWNRAALLRAPETPPGAQFGTTLELVGEEIWIGAPGVEGSRGRLYRFARASDGGWAVTGMLEAPSAEPGDGFGGSIAVAGEVGVVGLPNDDLGMGTAIFLARRNGGWTGGEKVFAVSKGLEAITGGKRDCAEGKVQLFDCSNTDLLAFLPVSAIGGGRGVMLNDIWGWTDPQSGREYALVGRMDGTAFVDVTDPVNPRFLGDLPLHTGARPNAWRDIKVYKDHAFIVADGAGPHGMQVFDLTRLRNVPAAPARFTEDAHYAGIASAHNIVIDTTSGFGFAVGVNGGGESCGGALHMIDIRSPKQPTFAGCFADNATGQQRTGYTHDAQCVVYNGPDQTYRGRQICFNSSETALGIADVTDKASPKAIAHAAYPAVAYAHQGWLTDDHRYFYMNDEGDEGNGLVEGTRTIIWDVNDLDEPVFAGQFVHDNPSTDHNLYVNGNLMYQSNYQSGLRILDISDPLKPVLVGYFDTVPTGQDTAAQDGSWSNYPYFKSGTLIVTSMREGFFILRKSDRILIP